MEVLPERVTVGFSAATGVRIERNSIQSWEFSSSLDIKETTRKEAEYISLIVELAVVGMIIIVFVMLWIWKGNKMLPTTSQFSSERKLGQGGFGAVYKGYLTDLDMPVAVKKISRESKQGKKEYITEVKIFSQLRHRNLLQLIGCCHDGVEFLLVYEFIPNGSLDSQLFGTRSPLSWLVRYKISLGLASSLLYLHEEWEQCVGHRDIKSSNVMLDSNFNVKLGDFGLARLMDHELSRPPDN
nr:l-type lectin-domain containing receptor kinase ix.1 [Quercus suber]